MAPLESEGTTELEADLHRLRVELHSPAEGLLGGDRVPFLELEAPFHEQVDLRVLALDAAREGIGFGDRPGLLHLRHELDPAPLPHPSQWQLRGERILGPGEVGGEIGRGGEVGFGRGAVPLPGGHLGCEQPGSAARGGVIERRSEGGQGGVGIAGREEETGQPEAGPGMIGGEDQKGLVVGPGLRAAAERHQPLRAEEARPNGLRVAADRLFHERHPFRRGEMGAGCGSEEGPTPSAVVEGGGPPETGHRLPTVRLRVEHQPQIPPRLRRSWRRPHPGLGVIDRQHDERIGVGQVGAGNGGIMEPDPPGRGHGDEHPAGRQLQPPGESLEPAQKRGDGPIGRRRTHRGTGGSRGGIEARGRIEAGGRIGAGPFSAHGAAPSPRRTSIARSPPPPGNRSRVPSGQRTSTASTVSASPIPKWARGSWLLK